MVREDSPLVFFMQAQQRRGETGWTRRPGNGIGQRRTNSLELEERGD
jgi:hypothetical protein